MFFTTNVVTKDGDIVEVLGAGDGVWRAKLAISSGPTGARILGNNEVCFQMRLQFQIP